MDISAVKKGENDTLNSAGTNIVQYIDFPLAITRVIYYIVVAAPPRLF